MIKVFAPDETDFTSSNGEIVIQPTRALVTKEDNGDYYLELECDLKYVDYIKPTNIIAVDLPQGTQGFRIVAPVETTRTKIKVKAYHLYYDSNNYVIADSYVVNKNCQQAMRHLNSATDETSPFTMYSDISDTNSYRCVRKSLNEALGVILERWGGHLVRDNFKISINQSIGSDNGVTIQYRKNLKEITVTEDWSGVCTKCLPVGTNGTLLDSNIYVWSQYQYRVPFTRVVSFDQSNINRDDYETEEAYIYALRVDLKKKAEDYLEIAQYPVINYTVSANVDYISDIGDTIRVYDERLGVDLLARVISFVYDCILGKYIQVQFGTMTQSLSNLMSGINSQISTAVSESQQDLIVNFTDAINTAVAQIWDDLTDSYTIIDGDKILIVDRLPSSQADDVIKIDQNGVSISHTGVTGTFSSVFSISGDLDFNHFDVVGLTLSMISGGVLQLGGSGNTNGSIEIYNSSSPAVKIGEITKDGFKTINSSGDYYLLSDIGLSGYDSNDNLVSQINNDGLIIKGENPLEYIDGDTETIIKKVVSGYINSTSTEIVFTVDLPKKIDSLSVTISTLKVNGFKTGGGDLFGSYVVGGYDILNDATLTVTPETTAERYITLKITKTTPLSVVGSSPVVLSIEELGLSFS